MTQNNGYLLPDVADAPRLCFTVSVPNTREHIAAFMGQLSALGYWYNWERDPTHFAREVSKVWFNIYRQVSEQYEGGNTSCEVPITNDGSFTWEEPEMQGFRTETVNGKCHLQFLISSCPDVWVTVANLGDVPPQGQAGSGNAPTPPAPGGGTQDYCYKMMANQVLLLPVLVNTDDVITMQSQDGSGWDGAELSPYPVWRCPDGQIFSGGQCEGGTVTNSGDLLPITNHMQIIAEIGNTPKPFVAGSITVPSGVVNEPLSLVVNCNAVAPNQGSYDVCVRVKNNQTANWGQLLEFFSSQLGWGFLLGGIGSVQLGNYTPSVGFVTEYFPATNNNELDIYFNCVATFTSGFLDVFTTHPMSWAVRYDVNIDGTAGSIAASGVTAGTGPEHIMWVASFTCATRVVIDLYDSATGASSNGIRDAQFYGTGINPFV